MISHLLPQQSVPETSAPSPKASCGPAHQSSLIKPKTASDIRAIEYTLFLSVFLEEGLPNAARKKQNIIMNYLVNLSVRRLTSVLLTLSAGSAVNVWAMPGAPMLPLSEVCSTCATTESHRPVVVHEAFGELHPNQMPDWAEILSLTIEHFRANGEFKRRQQAAKDRLTAWAQHPKPASALPRAEADRVHRELFPAELRRALEGFHDAPQASSAVSSAPVSRFGGLGAFHRKFLLIDGSDPEQRRWAAKEAENVLLTGQTGSELMPSSLAKTETLRTVLVQGDLAEAAQALPQLRLWFDQGGSLRRRFGVTALPAKAELSADGLLVEEKALPSPSPAQHP